MQIVLKILKVLGLTIFALGILGSMATTLNFLFSSLRVLGWVFVF